MKWLEKLPPILYFPVCIIVQFIFFIGWLLGFFVCWDCEKVFWSNQKNIVYGYGGYSTRTICNKCSHK